MVTDMTSTLKKLRNTKATRLQKEATKVALRFVTTENFDRLKSVFQHAEAVEIVFHNPLQDRAFTQSIYLAHQ